MNIDMTPKTKFYRTATFKAFTIVFLTLFMLIPGVMVQDIIWERKHLRDETVQKIDAKWSYAQTISGPVLVIPYMHRVLTDGKIVEKEALFYVTPEAVNIDAVLFPEERHYGIYKTILYKSDIGITGNFLPVNGENFPKGTMLWDKAYINLGISDLRGISDDIDFSLNGDKIKVLPTGDSDYLLNQILRVNPEGIDGNKTLEFACKIELKGSGSINFVPVGRTTEVSVKGAWEDPGFIGNHTADYTIADGGFMANWKVLSFNRSIPDTWTGGAPCYGRDISFGVNLVETVDIYQQNMRSAKYAIMFIALTFVIFFFVEVLNKQRIHPIQYILVGVALILFYSLLLSISEPLGFGWAYLISSIATIGLITGYTSAIFKNIKQTMALGGFLSGLYVFLYVILQLEDMALLAGSIGLFLILSIVMYFSRKINWYGGDSQVSAPDQQPMADEIPEENME